jgi:DNA-binding CsgD family transcriptional regulator
MKTRRCAAMQKVSLRMLSTLSDVDLLTSSDAFFDMLLNFLIELVNSNVGVISIFRKDEEIFRSQLNISAQDLEVYKASFFAHDPLHPCRINPAGRNPKSVTASYRDKNSAVVGSEEQYYFMRDYNLHHTIRVTKRLRDNSLLAFWLYRPITQTGFGENESDMFQELLPFIANLVETNMLLTQLDTESSLLLSTEEKGFVFVDENFHLLSHNKKAAAYFADLGSGCSLPEHVRQLAGRLPLENGAQVQLFSPDRDVYLVKVTACNSKQSTYLLKITPQAQPPALAAMDALTAKEKKIVAQIIKGLNCKQIASLMFISEHTVKTHLRNIYHKLEISSRAALLHKINAMPEAD